jgi:deoxyribonuclease V
MKPVIDHDWDVSVAEARKIQFRLAPRVSIHDALSVNDVSTVAGIDNGYVSVGGSTIAFAAVVVMRLPSLDVVETVVGEHPATFPYVPGLLTFREAPAIITALKNLTIEPDILLFDGHGYAHPKRFGLASHMGVVLDWPSIGCAKSNLTGTYNEPRQEFGAMSPLTDKGEFLGVALRSLPGHSPLFISPGHKLSIATAADVALACCTGKSFMPRPTQAAHNLVAESTCPLRRK